MIIMPTGSFVHFCMLFLVGHIFVASRATSAITLGRTVVLHDRSRYALICTPLMIQSPYIHVRDNILEHSDNHIATCMATWAVHIQGMS
jgi:hypothetical protein